MLNERLRSGCPPNSPLIQVVSRADTAASETTYRLCVRALRGYRVNNDYHFRVSSRDTSRTLLNADQE